MGTVGGLYGPGYYPDRALFMLLALIGINRRKGKPAAYFHFSLFMGVAGLLIVICGVLD